MKVLNNLKIQHNCGDCEVALRGFFCDLQESTLQNLESLKISNVYPRGSVLFIEGQASNGVYILCRGRVKLSTCSREGKVIILQIAEAGEVLGLSAVVSDSAYEATAEVLEPCQVSFVRKADFLRFLQQNTDACLSAVRQLSQNYQTAHLQICSLGLSSSVADKLAKLFLGWCNSNGNGNHHGNGSVRMKISYTHEEIAEMIGTSRETVSRLLKTFRERNLITLKGSDLVIHDKKRLEMIVGI
ncbi:MAG TPA: Crp/Fnr family transcriptional regulator [Pyrinomonadaceae bacterium]|nr:Crp/Fnr family transcriptional regulator [Pyrinomonadaceae bacterium]